MHIPTFAVYIWKLIKLVYGSQNGGHLCRDRNFYNLKGHLRPIPGRPRPGEDDILASGAAAVVSLGNGHEARLSEVRCAEGLKETPIYIPLECPTSLGREQVSRC